MLCEATQELETGTREGGQVRGIFWKVIVHDFMEELWIPKLQLLITVNNVSVDKVLIWTILWESFFGLGVAIKSNMFILSQVFSLKSDLLTNES